MRWESSLLETGRAGSDVSTNDVAVGTVNDGMLMGNHNEASTTSRNGVVDGNTNPVESGNEAMDRNIFNTRCHQAGSMPEEDKEVVVESNESTTSQVDTNVVQTTQNNIAHGGLRINENTQSNTATTTVNTVLYV